MSKITKDRLAPEKKQSGKYPWDFKAPSYDNRTSCSISAGNDYGKGKTQPIGKEAASGLESGPIPMQSKCWEPKPFIHKKDVQG